MELVHLPLLNDRGMVEGVDGYTGCPSAADLAVILGVVDDKTASRLASSLSGAAQHGSPQEALRQHCHRRVSGRTKGHCYGELSASRTRPRTAATGSMLSGGEAGKEMKWPNGCGRETTGSEQIEATKKRQPAC